MTDRFEHILVAMSLGQLEPDALRTASQLAEASGARVTMLDVVDPMPLLRRVRMRRRITEIHTEIVRERSASLRRLAAEIRPCQDTNVEVVVGHPWAQVIERVMSHRVDLVIVGGGSPATSEAYGLSNGLTQLLRKCPVPVLVLRPPLAGSARVLALVDPDPGDPVRDGLNERVLDLAASMARDVHADLHVGHALERGTDPSSSPSSDGSAPGEPVSVAGESARGPHVCRLDALLERHCSAASDVGVHVVAGHAGEVLPSLADDLGADLIVMGTVARSGISGMIIGNSAETMLQSVHCSVLAIKPDDVVSPVGSDLSDLQVA